MLPLGSNDGFALLTNNVGHSGEYATERTQACVESSEEKML